MDKRRAFLQFGCMPLEDLARPHRKRQSMMIGVFGTSPEFHQAERGRRATQQGSRLASRVSYRDRRERDVRGRPHPSSAQDLALARRGHRLHRWILPTSRVLAPKLDDASDLRPAGARVIQSRRLEPARVGKLDWHNDLSRVMLDINDAVDKDADDRARAVAIRRLRNALTPPQ